MTKMTTEAEIIQKKYDDLMDEIFKEDEDHCPNCGLDDFDLVKFNYSNTKKISWTFYCELCQHYLVQHHNYDTKQKKWVHSFKVNDH